MVEISQNHGCATKMRTGVLGEALIKIKRNLNKRWLRGKDARQVL
jgi:hypothetical protein